MKELALGFCLVVAAVAADIAVGADFTPARGCTMEAKICSDGSSVGRSGPNCDFDPCPGESSFRGMSDFTSAYVPPPVPGPYLPTYPTYPGYPSGGGWGGYPNYCFSNNDCGPARCCRQSGGYFGLGTCGPQGQFGDSCSPFGCGCASGLTCSGGTYGSGTCVYSGGGGGGGSCGYCPPGSSCKPTGIVCVRWPCPQSYSCVPDSPGGGEVTGCWQCPYNTKCERIPIYCFTYPCPDRYRCVPFDLTGNCGQNEEYTSCGSSSCWEEKCGQPKPDICTADCRSGCRCKSGFKRNYDGSCTPACYVIGRPFSSDKGYVTSAILPLSRPELNVSTLETIPLLQDEQEALAASYWSRIALMEHASVASFSRFSMQLMSVGAPLPLLQAAHQAAQEEVKHAQIAISFANKFGKTNIMLGDFPLTADHLDFGNLTEIAKATTVEGCIEESISALITKIQAEGLADPTMRAIFREVADEEVSHAVLAWRSIKWMLAKSPAIRSSVADVFSTFPRPEHVTSTPQHSVLEDVGILPVEKMEKLREIGWHKIVVPTAASLGLLDTCEDASEDMLEATRIQAMLAHSLE